MVARGAERGRGAGAADGPSRRLRDGAAHVVNGLPRRLARLRAGPAEILARSWCCARLEPSGGGSARPPRHRGAVSKEINLRSRAPRDRVPLRPGLRSGSAPAPLRLRSVPGRAVRSPSGRVTRAEQGGRRPPVQVAKRRRSAAPRRADPTQEPRRPTVLATPRPWL